MATHEKLLDRHLKLLSMDAESKTLQHTASRDHEINTTPLFSNSVRAALESKSVVGAFPAHSLLAGNLSDDELPVGDIIDLSTNISPGFSPSPSFTFSSTTYSSSASSASPFLFSGNGVTTAGKDNSAISKPDPRIFLNVNTPWSAFICGSQGSGKSYTLSCLLESCLIASPELGNLLPCPLAGLVFHYDKHIGTAGAVCEAAYLCSAGIPVTVLVSESSRARMERLYGGMNLPAGVQPPRVQVLKFKDRHLNLERLMSLMCVSTEDKKPLYLETITKILREMATESSNKASEDYFCDEGIDYPEFRSRVKNAKLKPDQLSPLNLRLDILESFLEKKWTPPKQVKGDQERIALEKAALEKAALDKAALDKAALDKVALEKATQEKAYEAKAARRRAFEDKAAHEKLVREQAAWPQLKEISKGSRRTWRKRMGREVDDEMEVELQKENQKEEQKERDGEMQRENRRQTDSEKTKENEREKENAKETLEEQQEKTTIISDPWITKPGTLTIVDLSSPFIDESSACDLFSMCLSLFLENDSEITTTNPTSAKPPHKKSPVGKVVALDEAHKFMTSTPGSETFTHSLLSTIRMQRHYGVRVIIATQEPTISSSLMDLSSLTLVHRFSSPSWFNELKGHLPGVKEDNKEGVFKSIVELETGEALLFCPSALLGVREGRLVKLGVGRRKVRIRKRVTDDGGGSVMAS